MAKLNGATWDKMSRDARKDLLKKTGSFPGNVGKSWAELTDGAKARLTGDTVAEAKTKPEKKPAVVAGKATKTATGLDREVVRYGKEQLKKYDGDSIIFGRFPSASGKELQGLYFLCVPSTGEIIKSDCKTQKEALAYVEAICPETRRLVT